MPRARPSLYACNRGEVGPGAFAREDQERLRLAAETMLNWLPKTLGPMRIRPGLKYLGTTDSDNAAQFVEFIAGTTDTALLELTASKMRVWIDDELLSRVSVSTAISNGTFSSSTGWTDGSSHGGSLTFDANGLELEPNAAGGVAKCTREITVAGDDQNKVHGLKIQIGGENLTSRPVTFRVGSAGGGDDYIAATELQPGWHHLAFTPAGNFHLTFQVTNRYGVQGYVRSIEVESSGAVEITTPFGSDDLDNIKVTQSADVIFVACGGVKQHRIERRNVNSWSVAEYRATDGPFVGKTADLEIKVSQTWGEPTLTANRNFFKEAHEGALLRLFHSGQNLTMKVSAGTQYTDPIRVAGVKGTHYNERAFDLTTAGTWSATVSTRRSIEGPDRGYGDYPRDANVADTVGITTNTTYNNEDEDDNLIAWYRAGINDGDYTSGVVTITLSYDFGGDFGIVEIGNVASATSATGEILRACRGTTYTAQWLEGAWSELQGWPTAVELHESRLAWAGGVQIWLSVVDAYQSFDQENVNDDGPIIRTIGQGPVDEIHWMVSLDDLVLGTAGGEWSAKASSFNTPLTPTDFSLKNISTYGSKATVQARKLDDVALFVHRSGKRLYQIAPADTKSGYASADLTVLHPDILDQGVVSMAVQRHPDTRVHMVLGDGTAVVLTYNAAEELRSLSRIETDGEFERVAVLSDDGEDKVYFVVKRTIDGNTKRHIELLATEAESAGATVNYIADAAVSYSGLATTTITGLDHLEGESVVVWADGNVVEEEADGVYSPKLFTVSAGQIELDTAASDVVTGLPFTAQWKSVKLGYGAGGGSALSQKKRVIDAGLLLGTTHHRGVRVGRNFDKLFPPPTKVEGATVADGTIFTDYDEPMVPFAGEWNTDSRICIQGQAPYPAAVKAIVFGIETSG